MEGRGRGRGGMGMGLGKALQRGLYTLAGTPSGALALLAVVTALALAAIHAMPLMLLTLTQGKLIHKILCNGNRKCAYKFLVPDHSETQKHSVESASWFSCLMSAAGFRVVYTHLVECKRFLFVGCVQSNRIQKNVQATHIISRQ